MGFREGITISEVYTPAMRITSRAAADKYFEQLVQHHLQHPLRLSSSRADVERIERNNLYYFAGFYDAETGVRVERLFNARPIKTL